MNRLRTSLMPAPCCYERPPLPDVLSCDAKTTGPAGAHVTAYRGHVTPTTGSARVNGISEPEGWRQSWPLAEPTRDLDISSPSGMSPSLAGYGYYSHAPGPGYMRGGSLAVSGPAFTTPHAHSDGLGSPSNGPRGRVRPRLCPALCRLFRRYTSATPLSVASQLLYYPPNPKCASLFAIIENDSNVVPVPVLEIFNVVQVPDGAP